MARVQERLRASAGDNGVRWEKSDKFHYTLKFLGDTPPDRLPLAIEAAREAAAQTPAFSLTASGVGVFPQQRRPQVVWIGAKEGVPVLTRLAESLDERLAERGFEPETRRFHAHATLARAKSPEGQESIAKTFAAEASELNKVDKYGIIPVESFVLMQSELRPAGSVYTVLESFALT